MALITTTCSPSSLQIRLAFSASNSTKFPILHHSRVAYLDRRFRFPCVAQNGNGSDSVPGRVGSDGSAGWTNAEVEEHSISSQKKKKKESYEGVTRVGVAGVLLLSGLTFAVLFVSRRNSAKQQMKPLTTHEEVLLSSDVDNDEITEHVNVGKMEEQTSCKMEGQVHTSRDCSSPEHDKILNYYGIVDDSIIGSPLAYDINNTYIDTDATTNISVQEELQHESAVDDKLVIHSEGAMTLNFSESKDADDSQLVYDMNNTYIDVDSTTNISVQEELQHELAVEKLVVHSEGAMTLNFSESKNSVDSQLVYDMNNTYIDAGSTTNISGQEELQHESAVDDKLVVHSEDTMALNFSESENAVDSLNAYEFKENPFNVEPRNMSNIDPEHQHLITEQHDEITVSRDSRRSEISVTSSFVADNENVLVNVAVNPQSNNTISDPEVFLKADRENALSASTNENLDISIIAQASANLSLEEQSCLEDGMFKKSLITSTNTFTGELVVNDINEANKSRSDSPNSGLLFSAPGVPAPSVVSAVVQALPGKILVPAAVDQVQGQALAALQVLKVIEPDVQPGDLCTRREYARWLVSASSALSRKTIPKVYPAMYVDNFTELAFDDIAPEDPDFSSIQGLAEAGLIESRLSRCNRELSADEDNSPFYFSPESPLSRQDLVSWKMVLEKRQLPEADRKMLYQLSGFLDVDKIHSDAYPALVADISAGEQGIIALAFGYTRFFQPHKPVTKSQAAVALATGDASDIVSEELARIEAESMAEKAVAAHSALVDQVEKDINASFKQELSIEREKMIVVERMAEEARFDLERLRAEREVDKIALIKECAAIESERDVFSRLRHEVEDQLQNLMNNKVEIVYEKERITKLREEAEVENKEIVRLQYELEVERKALSMARAWAEDEAKRVREHAEALERARDRWERHGIKVAVDDDIREEASAGVTSVNAEDQFSVQSTVDRAYSLLDKLKSMAADVRGKARDTIDKVIHMISQFISRLREWANKNGKQAEELREAAILKAGKSVHEVQQSTLEFVSVVKEGVKRFAGDCRGGVEKLTQKFKT